MSVKSPLLLLADIGGTNTRVALAQGETVLPDTVQRFRNAEFSSLGPVLRQYAEARGGLDCQGACVAVAGPVKDGVATLTNLDWTIDHALLTDATGAETVDVLNDLQAQGHALGHIADESLRCVVQGHSDAKDANRLVIGVGTGFNAAPVIQTGTTVAVPASEAGHANLPIRTEADLRLANYVEAAHGFPAVEDVLSGRGIERIYAWLSAEAGEETSQTAAQIVEACQNGSDVRAEETLRTFIRVLGTEAGNLALVHLPFGGIYLVGGVSRHVAPWFSPYGFTDAFRDKGRFGPFMEAFSIYVVEDDYAALSGCASYLSKLF